MFPKDVHHREHQQIKDVNHGETEAVAYQDKSPIECTTYR